MDFFSEAFVSSAVLLRGISAVRHDFQITNRLGVFTLLAVRNSNPNPNPNFFFLNHNGGMGTRTMRMFGNNVPSIVTNW